MREGSLLPTRLWTSFYFPCNVPAIWPAPRDRLPHHHPLPWQPLWLKHKSLFYHPADSTDDHLYSQLPTRSATTPVVHALCPQWSLQYLPLSASCCLSHSILLSPVQLTFCGQTLQLCSHAQPRAPRPLSPTFGPAVLTAVPDDAQSWLFGSWFGTSECHWRKSQAFADLTLLWYILVPTHKSLFLSAAELRYVPQRSSGMLFLFWTPTLN